MPRRVFCGQSSFFPALWKPKIRLTQNVWIIAAPVICPPKFLSDEMSIKPVGWAEKLRHRAAEVAMISASAICRNYRWWRRLGKAPVPRPKNWLDQRRIHPQVSEKAEH